MHIEHRVRFIVLSLNFSHRDLRQGPRINYSTLLNVLRLRVGNRSCRSRQTKRDTVIQLSNEEAITDHACGAYCLHHNHLSGSQLLKLGFDFLESRLLQLLIQRGKIGFE